MQRRAFLAFGSQTALFALAAGVAKPHATSADAEPPTQIDVEQRVASVIATYDAQGNHRTGTAVDKQSGEWLAAQMRRLGVEPVLEPFTLERVDLRSCYLRIADRRIDLVFGPRDPGVDHTRRSEDEAARDLRAAVQQPGGAGRQGCAAARDRR